ncbi:MAG: lamin tail domain-containing protein, partial [Opitutales bacterium]|nr:lamin tail domain-containing protein [Opitutales bacterium]
MNAEQIVFTEIHYNPSAGMPEFIEVTNNTSTVFDIADWQLKGGVTYQFPSFSENEPTVSFLKAFERILLSPVSESELRLAYPSIPEDIRIFGSWKGKLNNAGERVSLENKNGTLMCEVSWSNQGLWPPEADGSGHSLVLRNPNHFIDDYRNWTFSAKQSGTPGRPKIDISEQETIQGNLLLSEVYMEDGLVKWVEVYNAGQDSIDLQDVRIASMIDFSNKVELEGSLSGGGWMTFDCNFALDRDGKISLFMAQKGGTVLDAVVLKRLGNESGYEKFPPRNGEWYRVDTSSKSTANNPLRETSIIINEIMMDPPSDQNSTEFIELHNKGDKLVSLGGWKFTHGVNFTFPSDTMIEPGNYLVVAHDKDRIKKVYGDIPVIGNYSGGLANAGEYLRLEDNQGNLVDSVHYQVQGDWPDWTNGGGSSMELVNPEMDNSLASAWRDSDESAKPSNFSFSFNSTYEEWDSQGTASDYKELHMFLSGDGEVIIDKLSLQKDGTGANLITNVDKEAVNGNGATGWLCQGNHHQSHIDALGRIN